MNKSIEKYKTKRIGGALLAWLMTAALLMLVSAAMIGRMRLRKESIVIASAGIIVIASAAASLILFRSTKGSKRWMPALLLWAVIASTLLMLGFLIDNERMTASGSIRILLSSLTGSLTGVLLTGKQKRNAGRGKFMKAK